MPTPVTAARQCLAQDSVAVLDEAVAVARRRGHAHTTSLHMVSSLLSLPNSSLREACTRTRNNAYSTRVQFKALELSLSVSLDRLPSSQASRADEPPVSNSLMAAIKRSQANQRRQPENFTFYQQQQQNQYSSCSSVPVVKVELQNLVLSILDDPLVSRVFGEAGFRSCDIKMATLMPGKSFHPSRLFGCTSRYKRPSPPLFLCNFSDGYSGVGGKGFSFPFMGCFSGDDENSRRIGAIMLRDKKRSPLLLGVSAGGALSSFLKLLQRKTNFVLPDGLSGLSVVCVKDEILMYLSGDSDETPLKSRFEEVEKMLSENDKIVVNFGDLQVLAGDGVGIDRLRYLVRNLARLIEVYVRKVWLIGEATTYDVYVKILNKFPTIEQDWDLEILPITSVGSSYPRSSLMESFVPLGGFFSMPPETRSPLSNARQYGVRCPLCNEKYEQEVAALSDGGVVCASVAQQYQSNLPSWLCSADPAFQSGSPSIKGKDDKLLLNAKIMGLQKKWDGICFQQHQLNQTSSKGYTRLFSHPTPRVLGFQVAEDGKERASENGSNYSNESSNDRQGNKNVPSSLSTDLRHSSSLNGLNSVDKLPKGSMNPSLLSKPDEKTLSESNGEQDGLRSHHFDSLSASPTSITSVTTDLGLGINKSSNSRESEKYVDTFTGSISKCSSQSSPFFYRENQIHPDVKDPKLLYKALVEIVGRQEEAIGAIVEAMTRCQTKTNGVSQRNTWINLRGPDRFGKRKIGLALAEMLYRSKESLIYVDLSFQDEISHADSLFNSQVTNKYESTMRGTVLDYLVEKLSKRPSLILLENIDMADLVVQNSLFEAVKAGRLTDMCGREVKISNCVFMGSTRLLEGGQSMSDFEESAKYTEEDVLMAKGNPIQILIRFDLNDDPMSQDSCQSNVTRKGSSSDVFLMNKRKLEGRSRTTKRAHKPSKSYLDLNLLPVEGSDQVCNTLFPESDSDSSSDHNSRSSWLEEFEAQIDQTVVLKAFDFETLAEKLVKDVTKCLYNIVGSECSIEIEPNVVQQLLAAVCLYGNKKVEDWIRDVASRGFTEAMGSYSIDARSIVKLVSCDVSGSEQGLLPDRIMMK